MFTEPLSIKTDQSGEVVALRKVGVGNYSGTYRSADGMTMLDIQHTVLKNGRESSLCRLKRLYQVTNPLTGVQTIQPVTAHIVLQTPANSLGIEPDQLRNVVAGLTEFLAEENLAHFLGKES